MRRDEGWFACLTKEQLPFGHLNVVSLPQENLQKLVHIEHSVRGQSGLLQPGRVSAAGRTVLIRTLFPASFISLCVDSKISDIYRCCFLPYCDNSIALVYVSNHHSGSAPWFHTCVSGHCTFCSHSLKPPHGYCVLEKMLFSFYTPVGRFEMLAETACIL